MTIYKYYSPHYGMSEQQGRFGLEIETETINAGAYGKSLTTDAFSGKFVTDPPSKFWTPKGDGSLRNYGVEFVLKKPHDLKGVRMALDEFATIFKDVKFIKDAPATSVHVHMNVQHLLVRQLGNLIVLWTLFENLLVEYSGEPRRSNLFTLPMRCAEGNVRNVVRLFTSLAAKSTSALSFQPSDTKYAAMNLSCLGTLGTLEVRCFRGETDPEKIFEWIKILNYLYEYALLDVTPNDILARYRKIGFDLFFEVFMDMSEEIIGDIDDPSTFIDRNLFYAAIMADSVEDWNSIDPIELPEVPAPKKKKLTDLSTAQSWSLPVDTMAVVADNTMIIVDDTEFNPFNNEEE